jgi:hypothetical protein
MKTRTYRVAASVTSVVAAAGIGLAGQTAAGAQAAGPNEHFTVVVSASTNTGTVIANGRVFNAVGTDAENLDASTSTYAFPDGTLVIEHHTSNDNDHFNPRTCTDHLNESGTGQVIGATGAYAGASGTATYKLTGTFVAQPTSNGCDFSNGTGFLVIHSQANLSIPPS